MAESPADERITRRVRRADQRKEFLRLDDGRVYFVPSVAEVRGGGRRSGVVQFNEIEQVALSAPVLRALANELDKRNIAARAMEREERDGAR